MLTGAQKIKKAKKKIKLKKKGRTRDRVEQMKSLAKKEWKFIMDEQLQALTPTQDPNFVPSTKGGPYPPSPYEYRVMHLDPVATRDMCK